MSLFDRLTHEEIADGLRSGEIAVEITPKARFFLDRYQVLLDSGMDKDAASADALHDANATHDRNGNPLPKQES